MFVLVGKQGDLYAVQDTVDESIDIVPEKDLKKLLSVNIAINGVTKLDEDDNFTYSEENFFPETSEEDEEDFDVDSANEMLNQDYSDAYEFDDDGEEEEEEEESEEAEESDESDSSDEVDYMADYDDSEEDYDYDAYDTDDDEKADISAEDGSDDEDYDYMSDYADDDEDDYSVYEDANTPQEESGVSKLYKHLTEEQKSALKRYYIWYSQKIFNVLRKNNPALKVNNAAVSARMQNKEAKLQDLRNSGGLWHYVGFIDTGYFGGGSCTFGHTLRYLHLAWDVSVSSIEEGFWGDKYTPDLDNIIKSNNVIGFGIKCVTDFFEIDPACKSQLLKVQAISLKEMNAMASYYEDGKVDEVKDSFKLLDDIMTAVLKYDAKMKFLGKKDDVWMLPEGLGQFYVQFKSLGMMYPKSLVQQIRDSLVGWKDHNFIGYRYISLSAIEKPLDVITGGMEKALYATWGKEASFASMRTVCSSSGSFASAVRSYLELFFYQKMCGFYAYNPYSKDFKDEGGASKKMQSYFSLLSRSVRSYLPANAEFSVGYLKRLIALASSVGKWKDTADLFAIQVPDVERTDSGLYRLSGTVYMDSYLFNNLLSEYDEENHTDLHDRQRAMYFGRPYTSRFIRQSTEELEQFMAEIEKSFADDMANFKEWLLKRQTQKVDRLNECILRERAMEEVMKKEREIASAADAEAARKADEEAKASKAESDEAKHSGLSPEDITNYCIKEFLKPEVAKQLEERDGFLARFMENVIKRGSATERQMYHVNRVYTILTGEKLEAPVVSKKPITSVPDVVAAIVETESRRDELVSKLGEDSANKILAIFNTIKVSKNVSDKQMIYVEKAKKALDIK